MIYLESDIEHILWTFPHIIRMYDYSFKDKPLFLKWVDRQLKLPDGIADLVGITSTGRIGIVEVKKGKARGNHIAQVSRYKDSFQNIMFEKSFLMARINENTETSDFIVPYLCAEEFEDKTIIECYSCGVVPLLFSATESYISCTVIDDTRSGNDFKYNIVAERYAKELANVGTELFTPSLSEQTNE